MSKATVSGRQSTNTFAYMFIGAKMMLEQAERDKDGQLYNLVSCLIYCAFTIEAYLNHLGKLKYKNWEKTERKHPKLKKYIMLCAQAGVEPDFTQRPYSTLSELFAFRDKMAHGKTTVENITKEIELPSTSSRFTTEAEWQNFSSIENAKRAIQDTEDLVKELHIASGYERNPFNYLGGGMFGVRRHDAT
ncbi:hypothetical protein ACOWPK_19725 [Pseudomonas aeruginosa]|uniref:hypothetical protein n=1 Tax=Pseudomonas aeruginosa TaxID=287 RepID=UPI00129861F0|nr:hypothetical protein [Pseudomonas aeruginosa]MBX6029599.1 hypothetical protein [Pseudomonas aeruginosa]MCO3570011.1 hypothetical protein [Pseudomonas aeruginosa]HEP8042914.1 hypothetical protein [Pseudomonas aeruginosa]